MNRRFKIELMYAALLDNINLSIHQINLPKMIYVYMIQEFVIIELIATT